MIGSMRIDRVEERLFIKVIKFISLITKIPQEDKKSSRDSILMGCGYALSGESSRYW